MLGDDLEEEGIFRTWSSRKRPNWMTSASIAEDKPWTSQWTAHVLGDLAA